MIETIALNPNRTNGIEELVVKAYPTKCPSLFVHRSPDDHNWTLAHRETGYGIISGIKTRILAIEAGNLLSILPGLDRLTIQNCGVFGYEHRDYLIVVKRYALGTGPRPD